MIHMIYSWDRTIANNEIKKFADINVIHYFVMSP